MKKFYYLLIGLLLFVGCEKITPIPETFTFTVNETEMDFSENISVSKSWLSGEIEIKGKKTGVGSVTVILHEVNNGEFDENDYCFNENDFTYNYRLVYRDNNDNIYAYYTSSINEWFKLNIKKFENRTDGEVSGEFSGLLKGSFFNSSNAVDSVLIENGKFSTELIDKID